MLRRLTGGFFLSLAGALCLSAVLAAQADAVQRIEHRFGREAGERRVGGMRHPPILYAVAQRRVGRW